MIRRLLSFLDRWCTAQLHAFAEEHGLTLPDPEGLDLHIIESDRR